MKRLIFIILCTFMVQIGYSQFYGVRVNGVALLTGTLNVGAEMSVSRKSGLDLALYYNPIKSSGYKSQLIGILPAYKIWLAKPYVAGFISINGTYMNFDIGGSKEHQKGSMIGGGISYGYHFPVTRRLNMEFEIGVGCYSIDCDKYQNDVSYEEDEYVYHYKRLAILPSRCEFGFVYLF